jgi:hypothetical protein
MDHSFVCVDEGRPSFWTECIAHVLVDTTQASPARGPGAGTVLTPHTSHPCGAEGVGRGRPQPVSNTISAGHRVIG